MDTAFLLNHDVSGTDRTFQEPLTEWNIGEGLRRPVPLRDEAKPEEDEKEDTPEAAASTWKRQRDDWLFGRCGCAEHG